MAYWLLTVNAMIFVMILLGSITRLTGSGLSIMEWAPLLGTFPPLSREEWERLFKLYQQTLQFREVNFAMSLEGFRQIFWWEYLHRLWGRLIGLVFFLPLFFFIIKGHLQKKTIYQLTIIFALGMLQGAIGWIMVASGFDHRTEVSQYRLALHLGMALILYGLILWIALDFLFPEKEKSKLRIHGCVALGLISLEIIIGAFVAGLNAGLIDNNFPFMGDTLVAPDLFTLRPWWLNPFENPVMAQFLHRVMAGCVAIAVITLTIRVRRSNLSPHIKRRFYFVPCMLALQAVLGISTLILAVPLPLAIAHQAGAVLLLSAALFALHAVRK